MCVLSHFFTDATSAHRNHVFASQLFLICSQLLPDWVFYCTKRLLLIINGSNWWDFLCLPELNFSRRNRSTHRRTIKLDRNSNSSYSNSLKLHQLETNRATRTITHNFPSMEEWGFTINWTKIQALSTQRSNKLPEFNTLLIKVLTWRTSMLNQSSCLTKTRQHYEINKMSRSKTISHTIHNYKQIIKTNQTLLFIYFWKGKYHSICSEDSLIHSLLFALFHNYC